jgi:plastocyanin
MQTRRALAILTITAAGMVAACSGDQRRATDTAAAAPAAAAPALGATAAPAPGGKVIVVQLITDGTGNRFEPSKIEAHQGDVVRFTLQVGVHNVHFLPDSNPGKTGLPPASEMLQLPGQTYDLPVSFAPGEYFFQCDPHVALGMKGHLEVEKKS